MYFELSIIVLFDDKTICCKHIYINFFNFKIKMIKTCFYLNMTFYFFVIFTQFHFQNEFQFF